MFGFDFQRNAAIVLMLENIKELKSVRLEGNEEDIEISLNDGQKILAQAKAIEAKIAAGKQHYFGLCYILSATISRIHEKSILNGARWEVKFSVMRWEM